MLLDISIANKSQESAKNMMRHKFTSEKYKWDTKKCGAIKQVKLLSEISNEMTDFAIKFFRNKYFFWLPLQKGVRCWFLNKWICLIFMFFSSK